MSTTFDTSTVEQRPPPADIRRIPTIAVYGAAAQLFLLAVAWLLPAFSEYHLISDTISELALGRLGFVLTAAFAAAGLGTVAIAWSVRRLTHGARGSLLGTILLGVYGLGAILVAVFPTDRVDAAADVWTQSTTGTTHTIVAAVSFLSAVVALFVLTWTFRRLAGWRPLVRASALLAASALALFFVQQQGPLVGLLQRMLVTAIGAWLISAALRARSLASPQHADG
jgi:hypothetical protein